MADAVPSGLSGVGGAPVWATTSDALEAWVSDVPDAPRTAAEPAELAAHAAVADAALAGGRTPLPARFGQRFTSDEALWHALAPRQPEISRALGRVAGCVEMGVIVAPALRRMLAAVEPVKGRELDALERGAGLRYLRTVQARSRAGERLREGAARAADRASAAVASFMHGEARQELRPGEGVISITHLIARGDEARYRAAIASLRVGEGEDAWQFIVSEARAPFRFAALGKDGLVDPVAP